MVRVRVAVPVPPALVALMVTLVVPAAVGVPVMAPVAVLTARPAGRPRGIEAGGAVAGRDVVAEGLVRPCRWRWWRWCR